MRSARGTEGAAKRQTAFAGMQQEPTYKVAEAFDPTHRQRLACAIG